ncbi:MAG TPA: AcvB/VirJ family lysyl-phosphatidylglycerol hydrolase, partial [Steroidobacter sp.]|nr:AcvB/VirJ family lysyl-phosphatidylglycerol hydrolase [Steroidobacter sp.]
FHTWEPQFASAFQRLASHTRGLPEVGAAELKDLPVVEVHSSNSNGDTLALLISGDGGWAGIDKELAAALSKQGMPVVGLDSLRYFWKARTPEGTAADVDRLLRHYLSAWKKQSVLLIGFSQGADVMPFVVNRLPAATRERLRLVALLSLSETAVFEFHLQNWIGAAKNTIAVAPELSRMKGVRVLCVYGADETGSLCTKPVAKSLDVVKLSGGHHFDGNYPKIAALLLSHMH